MAKPQNRISDELCVECCQAIVARDNNGGSWPNGIPPCFMEVAKLYKWDDEAHAVSMVLLVETAVKHKAVEMIAIA